MSDEAVLEIRDLRLDYGSTTAVNGTSFTVRSGDIFALLGTNGAGKTTTMDVLEGYLKPTAGAVRVFGHNPRTDRPKIADDIGIMLQEAGFFEDLTVAETIKAWRRFTKNAVSVEEALRLVSLESKANTRIRRLSGGERRRVDLTLAVLGKPKLLFLDEPTTGLDPEARRETWHFLKAMADDGMTILLTTHYMEEAEFLANQVAIMDRGSIVRQGPMAEVVAENSRTRISFSLGQGLGAQHLPALPGIHVQQDGEQIHMSVDMPQQVLLYLLGWARDNGVELRNIEVRTASLEDVFLDVATTGKVAA